MPKMYVIQTGRTTWDDQTRVDSAPGAPLTESGQQDVQDVAKELASRAISIVYASPGQAEQETAQLVARALGAKVRVNKDLRELDYGLWQGLTREEIKRRQPSLYRQWTEAPASVRPPGGETLQEALERLGEAMRNILKRHRNGGALVVLRPVALGLVKCLLRRDGVESLWDNVNETSSLDVFEAGMNDLDGS